MKRILSKENLKKVHKDLDSSSLREETKTIIQNLIDNYLFILGLLNPFFLEKGSKRERISKKLKKFLGISKEKDNNKDTEKNDSKGSSKNRDKSEKIY